MLTGRPEPGRILQLGQDNAGYMYGLGEEGLRKSSVERDLGLLVGDRLNVGQLHALVKQAVIQADCILLGKRHGTAG